MVIEVGGSCPFNLVPKGNVAGRSALQLAQRRNIAFQALLQPLSELVKRSCFREGPSRGVVDPTRPDLHECLAIGKRLSHSARGKNSFRFGKHILTY